MDTPTGDDTFELQPRPVGQDRRPWAAVVAVTAAGLAIVAAAALAGGPSQGLDGGAGSHAPDAGASPVLAAVAAAATDGPGKIAEDTPAVAPRPMPASLTCHDLDRSACRLAVVTALGTLDGDLPSVDSAEAWSGLVCGDTLDCPPTRLDGRTTPLANVILRFAGGGPAAWINVMYRSHGRPLDFDPTIEAWIARWQAQP